MPKKETASKPRRSPVRSCRKCGITNALPTCVKCQRIPGVLSDLKRVNAVSRRLVAAMEAVDQAQLTSEERIALAMTWASDQDALMLWTESLAGAVKELGLGEPLETAAMREQVNMFLRRAAAVARHRLAVVRDPEPE